MLKRVSQTTSRETMELTEKSLLRQHAYNAAIQFVVDIQKYGLGDKTIAEKYANGSLSQFFLPNPKWRTYDCFLQILQSKGERMTASIFFDNLLSEKTSLEIRIYNLKNEIFALLVEFDYQGEATVIDSRY